MTRINVYAYADDFGQTTLDGWFNDDAATRYDEDTNWDGNNHVSVATGSQWNHEALYRTRKGQWVLNWWSQWQGSTEKYEFVSDERAKEWLLRNDHDDAVTKWFGELEEESGPPKGGRPAVGPAISTAYSAELLARIDDAAKRSGLSRAAWLRQIAAAAVSVSEQRAEAGA